MAEASMASAAPAAVACWRGHIPVSHVAPHVCRSMCLGSCAAWWLQRPWPHSSPWPAGVLVLLTCQACRTDTGACAESGTTQPCIFRNLCHRVQFGFHGSLLPVHRSMQLIANSTAGDTGQQHRTFLNDHRLTCGSICHPRWPPMPLPGCLLCHTWHTRWGTPSCSSRCLRSRACLGAVQQPQERVPAGAAVASPTSVHTAPQGDTMQDCSPFEASITLKGHRHILPNELEVLLLGQQGSMG